LSSLYFKSKESEKLELAEASLEHLIEELNAGNSEVEIYNPSGWNIVSWPYGDKSILPKSCSNLGWENCVCICNEETITRRIQGLADDCDNSGFCLEGDFIIREDRDIYKTSLKNSMEISNPPLKLIIKDKFITKNEP